MPERYRFSKLIEVTELFELHETPAKLHLELLEVQLLKKEVATLLSCHMDKIQGCYKDLQLEC